MQQPQPGRVQNGPLLTPIEISCVLGRRRRRGWCLVPVQSVGLSDSRFLAFLSFPQQSRPIYPPARPYPGTLSIIDQISDPYDIEVEREPLVQAHLPPLLDPPPAPPGEKAMEVEADHTDARLAEDNNDIAYIEEIQRRYRSQMSIRDLRQRDIADKAARQCRGDIGVYIYRWLPPPRGCDCGGSHSTLLLQAPAATR